MVAPRMAWRPKAVQPSPGSGSAVGAKVRRVVTIRPVNSRRGSLGGYGRTKAHQPPKQVEEAKSRKAPSSGSGVGKILLHKHSLKGRSLQRTSSQEGAGDGWDELEGFLEAIAAISAEIRPEEAAEKIIEETCRLIKADRTTLFFVDAEANELILVVAKGANNIRVPIGTGIAGTVAVTGTTANIPDAYKDSRFDPSFDKKTGYKTNSILCTPVRDPSGGIIAILQCINKMPSGYFSVSDQCLLESLASHVGHVLETAKGYEAETSAKAKVAAMLEIIKMVHSSSTSAHSLIFALSNRCHELVDGDRCTLYLVDHKKKELAVMQGDVDFRFPMTQGLAGAVATSGKHLIIDDCYEDPSFNKAIDLKTGYRTKAMLVMPVFGEEKMGAKQVVGVLQIINKTDDSEVFTASDAEVLSTILCVAGPILDRSNIFESKRNKSSNNHLDNMNELSLSPKTTSSRLSLPTTAPAGFAEEDEEEEDDF